MAAAEISADAAIKYDMPGSQVSGSTIRHMKELYLEGTKSTQDDWFLLTSYLTSQEIANIVGFRGVTKTSGNVMAADTLTYDDDDYKLDCTSANTGTVYCFVQYYTE